QDKMRESVSVVDYGADPSGQTDSTTAIDAALQETDSPYFPDGTYLYGGDIDALFARNPQGPGSVRFDGLDYKILRHAATNVLWPGDFNVWAMGHALGTNNVQRMQIPCGVTHARMGFSQNTTVYHVEGTRVADAMRIQRNATTADESDHVVVINLSREETKPLQGRRCIFEINGCRSSAYTGSGVVYRIQMSREPEQPILRDDGAYTSGNEVLAVGSIELPLVTRPRSAPFFITVDVPEDSIQVSVALAIGFSGEAPADDYVEFEWIRMYPGEAPERLDELTVSQQFDKASTRYQTSYPYGAPRGSVTRQGAVSAVAVTAAVNWAISIPIKFSPPMVVPPQFLFQQPLSGTESRLLDVDSNTVINGLGYDLSERGAVITNNAAAVVGHRYLCHWTASVIF
ncbi:glycosyl hydrolase family 28-related protein, partial [Bordetella trematum]